MMRSRRSRGSYPKRFIGFFTLPTCDIKASLDELERSVNDLGLRGFGCFANLNGQALDREELFPIYERLAKYKLPVYLHPTAPLATEATGIDIMPTLIFGWAFDSTVAMTRLVYGRVLERFPEINWVVADVGGVLAFFAQRAINIYTGRTDEIRHKYGLKENPLDSFRRFYVDTADHPASTLRCVKDFFGADRMVLGTNYPYGPEEGCVLVKNSLKAIDGLDLDAMRQRKNSRRQRGENSWNRSSMNFTKAARPVIMGQNGMVSCGHQLGGACRGRYSSGRRQRRRCRACGGVRHGGSQA